MRQSVESYVWHYFVIAIYVEGTGIVNIKHTARFATYEKSRRIHEKLKTPFFNFNDKLMLKIYTSIIMVLLCIGSISAQNCNNSINVTDCYGSTKTVNSTGAGFNINSAYPLSNYSHYYSSSTICMIEFSSCTDYEIYPAMCTQENMGISNWVTNSNSAYVKKTYQQFGMSTENAAKLNYLMCTYPDLSGFTPQNLEYMQFAVWYFSRGLGGASNTQGAPGTPYITEANNNYVIDGSEEGLVFNYHSASQNTVVWKCTSPPTTKIGDFVWYDTNGNGVQDSGEPGIQNATIKLYKDGNLLSTKTTNSSGNYLFEDLFGGDYSVHVDISTAVNLPTGISANQLVPTYDFDGIATPNVASGTMFDNTVSLLVDFGYRASNKTIAVNDINQTPQGVPVTGNVVTNDKDPEGHSQTVTNVTDANGNSITIGTSTTISNTNGTTIGNILINSNGTYTFTPSPSYTGTTPPLTYTITDSQGATDSATLVIEVIPSNGNDNPPVAQDDTNTAEQGETVTTYPLVNDSDLDGDVLTVTSVTATNSTGGTITLNSSPKSVYDSNGTLAGTASVNSSGNVIFQADNNYVGDVVFDYSIEDENSNSDSAIITITVNESSTNNSVHANDDANLGRVNQPQSGNIFNNDNDPQGDSFTVTLIDTNSDGIPDTAPSTSGNVITSTNGTTLGSITVNPTNGSYVWTPAPGYIGTAPVAYTITDSNSSNPASDNATLYLTTIANENATIAVNDINQTPQGTPVSGNILTNDKDEEGHSQTVTSAVDASGNSLPFNTITPVRKANGTIIGTIILSPTGTYVFTPNDLYLGETPPITYTATDSEGATDTATLIIEIIPIITADNPPVAQDDTNTVEQGASVTTIPLTNDSDLDGDVLTVVNIKGRNSAGNLITLNGNVKNVYKNGVIAGTAQVVGNNLVFTAASDFVGDIVFPYVIEDENNNNDSAIITITVEEAATDNDVYANDDANQGKANNIMVGNIFGNDYDPQGDTYTVTLIDTNSDGIPDTAPSASGNTITDGYGNTLGSIVVNATTGAYTWTPAFNYVGTAPVAYEIIDQNAVPAKDKATLYLTTIANLNSTYAINDINQTPRNVTLKGNILTNDFDTENDAQTITGAIDAAGNAINFNTPRDIYDADGDLAGSLTLQSNGSYTFVPTTNYTGCTLPVSYSIVDARGATDTAILVIKILPTSANDNPPIAQDDTNMVGQGMTVTTYPLTNDSDLDGDNLTITEVQGRNSTGSNFVLNSTPQNVFDQLGIMAGQASLDATGNLIFTADNDYVGIVPFHYTIVDENNNYDSANIAIIVTEMTTIHNSVIANDDSNQGYKNIDQVGNIFMNDSDPEVDVFAITMIDTNFDGVPDTAPTAGGNTIYDTDGTTVLGNLVLNAATGDYTWTPTTDYVGTANVAYEIEDQNVNPAHDKATLYLTTIGLEIPDLTPNIYIDQTTFTPGQAIELVVEIGEIKNSNTDGSTISFKIFKPANFIIDYNPNMLSANVSGGVTVNNNHWTMVEDAFSLTFTYTGNSGVMAKSSFSYLGFTATRAPNTSNIDQSNFGVVIIGQSGGEERVDNNQANIILDAVQ